MSILLRFPPLGIILLTTLGCATNQTVEHRPTEADKSGRAYVLAMGRHLAAAQQFTVRVHTDNDTVIDAGAVVGTTERTIRLRRPDRLTVRLVHPAGRRQIWYDGARLVCLEAARKAYASMPAKGSVERVFSMVRGGGHYVRPLAVLCDSDPGRSLCANARRMVYLGKADLHGRPCNRVRVEQENATLDLWILDSEQPLLLQASVRHADQSEPDRVSRFQNWDFQTPINDAEFSPQLPAGAYRIELHDLTGMP